MLDETGEVWICNQHENPLIMINPSELKELGKEFLKIDKELKND